VRRDAAKPNGHHEWLPAPTPIEPFREIHKPYIWRQGTPLFPEWKPLDFLLERKRWESEAGWSSLYQQHPIIVGGGELPIDKFKWMPSLRTGDVRKTVRAWDKAGSEREPGNTSGAATAGVLMHAMKDGTFCISHIARGHWSALERERKIRAWAEADDQGFATSPSLNFTTAIQRISVLLFLFHFRDRSHCCRHAFELAEQNALGIEREV
jgi:hypothetical protein